jgi:branched-chain amino acid aminotransferase
MKIYIDGAFFPESEAKISVFDHGLLYGDGVFEGIRFYNGRVFQLEGHLDRLWDSSRAICLTVPLSREGITAALLETIRQNQLRDGYIRLVITRGVGTLGLNPDTCPSPSVIIIAASIALYPEEFYLRGLDVITCGTRRVSSGALSPQVKSLNYLNNILAKIEAIQAGAGEGLMLNEQGFVAECTGDNVFVLKRGILLTPPISAGGLRGITRQVVFEIAAEFAIPVQEPEMTRYDIYTADECFLTGTAAEIIPVVSLDKRPIGSGKPGPQTARFIARFRELTQSSGTPIY